MSRLSNLQVQQEQELQEQFARQGLLNTLLRVVEECRLTAEQKRTLLPVVIDRVRQHWTLLHPSTVIPIFFF